MKICIACGMPMKKKEDFAQQDETKDYCLYCMKENGEMVSYEEKVEGTIRFIMETQGLAAEVARKAAIYQLNQLPHWQGREK